MQLVTLLLKVTSFRDMVSPSIVYGYTINIIGILLWIN
jgi:hypothetical protein